MLKIPFLRNILLIAFICAIFFPIYNLLYISPSYQELLVQQTEREASRFVRFMILSNHLDEIELRQKSISVSLSKNIHALKDEKQLIKLRIFSPSGEIVFSTVTPEVGTINNKAYFRDVVARGHIYSKMVHKQSATAEGVVTAIDLVETYVPVMIDGHFHGAMEVYYDITAGQKALAVLSRHSLSVLLAASGGLLFITLLVLFNARNSIAARDQAEASLQRVNDELENRVTVRTEDLSAANQLLATEIFERKKAQKALQQALLASLEERERIDSIISSVTDALLVTDHQDNILLINPAAAMLFNVNAVEVLGRRLPDVVGYDELLLEIAKSRIELGKTESVDFDFMMSREGTKHVYQGRASRLCEKSVNRDGLVLLVHDVTDERHIDQMKSEFVSMAAHELQTPLTMILGYSEILLDASKNFKPEEKREFLQIINGKTVELSRLVDDILDLSRIEKGQGLQLTFTPVDLVALSRQLVVDLEQTSASHRIVVEHAVPVILVASDRMRLMQMLDNLLTNAVKYSPAGGLIRIVLSQAEGWAQMAIIDQGIGMSAEEIANAFERFYRADSSITAVRGVGLGLSITKHIVDAHGGGIEIFSRTGKGTRVEIRLPLVV